MTSAAQLKLIAARRAAQNIRIKGWVDAVLSCNKEEILAIAAKPGSRREELNTPSTDYDSVALTLSYTGEFLALQTRLYGDRFAVPGPKV
jgi:hypothetical protein